MKEAHDHHRVSPEGKAAGEQLAHMAKPCIEALEAEGEPDNQITAVRRALFALALCRMVA